MSSELFLFSLSLKSIQDKNYLFTANTDGKGLIFASFQLYLVNVFLQELSPEQYFLENKLIQKSHARQYELKVKEEFKSWADEKQSKKVK